MSQIATLQNLSPQAWDKYLQKTLVPLKRPGKLAPCEQRRRQHLQLLSDVEGKDPASYFLMMGEIAKNDFYFYLTEVLQYSFLDQWLHGEVICNFLAATEGRSRLLLLPRGSAKTGAVTIPLPMWHLARDPACINIICNATEDRAARYAASAASVINLPRYQACYPNIVKGRIWGQGGYMLKQVNESEISTDRADPNIGSRGVGGNLVGTHLNGDLIHDDLITDKTAPSPIELKKVDAFYSESLNYVDPGTSLTIIGTRWVVHDFYGKIESGELSGAHERPEVLKLGVVFRDKSTGEDHLIWPEKRYFDQKRRRNRPIGYTFAGLEAKARGNRYFSANYYNNPVRDMDRKFDVETIKTFREVPFKTGPVVSVMLECESQANALLSVISKLMREQKIRMPLVKITSKKKSKEHRILSHLQSVVTNAELNMREDLYRSSDSLGQEFRDYDKGTDDCLDVAAYLSEFCLDNGQETPHVSIVCDPAFTASEASDYTAIGVGCRFKGELYILDMKRFKTDRTEVIAQTIFGLYRKWSDLASGVVGSGTGRYDMPVRAPRSSRAPQARTGRLLVNDNSFDVDDSFLYREKVDV